MKSMMGKKSGRWPEFQSRLRHSLRPVALNTSPLVCLRFSMDKMEPLWWGDELVFAKPFEQSLISECVMIFFQENSCQPSPPSLLSHKWRSLMEKLVVLKVNIKQNKTKKKPMAWKVTYYNPQVCCCPFWYLSIILKCALLLNRKKLKVRKGRERMSDSRWIKLL